VSAPLLDLLVARPLPEVEGGKEAKGDLVVVGGAPSCPGAAMLAATSALRCGSGRVQVVVHPEVATAVAVAVPEALVLGWDGRGPLPEAVAGLVGSAAAVVVGPGSDSEAGGAAEAISRTMGDGVLVLDAHALPALSEGRLDAQGPVLAAPNPKEACRLLGEDFDEGAELASLAERVSKLVDGPVAVRGAHTIVHDGGQQSWIETGGSAGLGTPGSGDVLIGALGAFLARGADPLAALGWAVATHARAGQLLAQERPVGFLAREVADALPVALRSLGAA